MPPRDRKMDDRDDYEPDAPQDNSEEEDYEAFPDERTTVDPLLLKRLQEEENPDISDLIEQKPVPPQLRAPLSESHPYRTGKLVETSPSSQRTR